MQKQLLEKIVCPITKTAFRLEALEKEDRQYGKQSIEVIKTGVLYAASGFFFPVINGVPRLLVEAFLDYKGFLKQYVDNYEVRKNELLKKYPKVITYVQQKNRRTKQSFSVEWDIYDYNADKTWHLDKEGIIETFLRETGLSRKDLKGKTMIDVGCGNGVLTNYIGDLGAEAIGMDMSLSVERAYQNNTAATVHFVQADLQFPPFRTSNFDLVHSSGVIHHTHNTELSFSIIHELVKAGGTLCVWLYHAQNNWTHRILNTARRFTSKLPIRFQYWLYFFTILPLSLFYKKIILRKQINWREQMVDLMDALSCEYRFEHGHEEAKTWYRKRGYKNVKLSTTNQFGFSIFGRKNGSKMSKGLH